MTFYPSALKLIWSGLLPAFSLSLKISLYSILISGVFLGFNRFGYASNSHSENRPSLKQEAISYQALSDGIEKIDIVLADVTTKVDIERQGNKIVLRLRDTKVEPGLIYKQHSKQRLLRSIYTDNKGKQGRIRIDIKQDFEYQSYQLGNKLTLTIEPVQRLTKPELTIKKYSGKPISVDFQNVEVRSVLHLLSQFMQTNIVASDEVTGTIMLNLINVPSDQALDIILSSKHLGKRVNGNVILVAPLAELAKQHENYLNAQQQKIARLPLRSEYIRLNYAKASEVHALILKASSQYIDNRINSRNYIENSGLESSHVNSHPAESDEASQLSSKSSSTLLSSRGVIAVDTRTNTLIVKDTADSINNIRMLISQIDIPVQQVMIEARIVSATDNFSKELGVKWGYYRMEWQTMIRC